MRIAKAFTPAVEEIDAMVARHPFAILVTGGDAPDVTPLPLMLERDADGRATLIGHFARGNPQVERLEADPNAMVVFLGPHGYISPSWFTDRTQAPTWNYAIVKMQVRVRIDRSEAAARAAVEQLTAFMEQGRPDAWSAAELGERFEKLIPAVVAFEAEVVSVQAKFKLGQNERPDVLREILAATRGQQDLHEAMRLANRDRLP